MSGVTAEAVARTCLLNEPFFLGALGGLMLAVGIFAASLTAVIGATEPEWTNAMAAFMTTAFAYASVGGTLSWVTEGRSGYFLTGLCSIGFVLSLLPDELRHGRK